MADIGERLGGDNIEFTVDKPLRIIIGGPPHSGKSTFMNLLEDRFRYYQIPVELLDLDLSAPTPLKTGFTQQRDKKKWTSTLAEEAKSMFEQAEGVQVVLGDSVGLISDINEIISQPADVAILLVSGGHGDYDTTYRKVVRKWKEYYEDIRTPLLVVLRSTMNPRDESMFDPQDNYGVVVGLDRDAYEANVISGHYRYDGLYPTNACLEGVVFEIAQSFDLKVRSATDPEHLDLLNQKWPDLKDKKTWTPPQGSMLGGIERAYFEERGRVPADQRAESFSADGWDSYTVSYREEEDDPHFEVDDDYDDLNEAMSAYQHFINTGMNSVMIAGYTLNEKGDYEEDSKPVAEYSKGSYDNRPQGYSAESFGADGHYLRKSKYDDNGRWDIYWEGDSRYRNYAIKLKDNPNDIRIVVEYGDGGYSLAIPQPDIIKNFSTMNEVLEYLDNMGDEGRIGQPSIGVFAHRFSTNRSYPTDGDWGAESFGAESQVSKAIDYLDAFKEEMTYDKKYYTEVLIKYAKTNKKPKDLDRAINYLDGFKEEMTSDKKYYTEVLIKYAKQKKAQQIKDHNMRMRQRAIDKGWGMSYLSAEDDLSFKEWADQETMTHGQQEPFDDWLNDELSSHGDNITLQDWGQHELDSHYERYGAEDNLKALKAIYTPYIGKQVRFITKYGLDKDDMFVDIETIHSIDWDGGEDEYDEPVFLNKEGDRWMTLDYVKENLVENKAAEGKIHSQLMIGSLIGLGAGLWAVNRFKESREER
tara:strand:- start:2211 stop:4475 length:2265 start_codon:yes stop_codon:yes gene_type:complete